MLLFTTPRLGNSRPNKRSRKFHPTEGKLRCVCIPSSLPNVARLVCLPRFRAMANASAAGSQAATPEMKMLAPASTVRARSEIPRGGGGPRPNMCTCLGALKNTWPDRPRKPPQTQQICPNIFWLRKQWPLTPNTAACSNICHRCLKIWPCFGGLARAIGPNIFEGAQTFSHIRAWPPTPPSPFKAARAGARSFAPECCE